MIDNRFISTQDSTLPKCIIVDIDGTLALINGRSPYDDTLIHSDKPNTYVVDLVRRFRLLYNLENMEPFEEKVNEIILMSGRVEKCRLQTEQWLDSQNITYDQLYMRKTGDYRQDAIVKKELYEQHIKNNYYVEAWFDDRDQVVKMVREELGLLCCQVYYGNF